MTKEEYTERVEQIEHIRTIARQILDQEGEVRKPLQPNDRMQRLRSRLHVFEPREEHVYDSAKKPGNALFTRAAAETTRAPIIKISELVNFRGERSDLCIVLSGKNPDSGDEVRILDILLGNVSESPSKTVVFDWVVTYGAMLPYIEYMDSRHATIISEVLVPSLEAVNRNIRR